VPAHLDNGPANLGSEPTNGHFDSSIHGEWNKLSKELSINSQMVEKTPAHTVGAKFSSVRNKFNQPESAESLDPMLQKSENAWNAQQSQVTVVWK